MTQPGDSKASTDPRRRAAAPNLPGGKVLEYTGKSVRNVRFSLKEFNAGQCPSWLVVVLAVLQVLFWSVVALGVSIAVSKGSGSVQTYITTLIVRLLASAV